MRILTVTGYKAAELGVFSSKHPSIPYIKKAIYRKLLSFLEEGLEWVLISGQLGVELWTAEVVFELQQDYPDLKLAVFTPFLGQEEKWNEANKEYYEYIVSQADHVDSITKRAYEGPEQFRQKNMFLIQKSDALLAVYDEEKEGSPKFLIQLAKLWAQREEYTYYAIDFSDLQQVIEEEQWTKE